MRLMTSVQLGLVIVLVLAGPAGAARPWWNDDWAFRREVDVGEYQPTGLVGDDIAVVTMPTAGELAADGRDIRVVTDGREVLPCRVLQVGPGDQVTVAFALREGKDAYHVYFGNPGAAWPEEALEIQRGILQESWRYPGGEFRTLAEAQAVLARVREFYGAAFRPTLFQGHNPFGPDSSVASLYTAYVEAPQAGEYTFCISSQNASFLTVDGQELLANGGRHAPQRDVTIQANIELSQGLHRLQFYHVSPTGDPIVVLAWQPPGGQRIWPMGAVDFAPVTHATPLTIEQLGIAASVDFLPDHAGETYFQNRYIQRYTFSALSSRDLGEDVVWQWQFGDGVITQGLDVEHVYLAPGEYTVTLTALNRKGQPSRSQRIVVNRPWDRVTAQDTDPLDDYRSIVSGYDLASLDAASLATTIVLADDVGDVGMLDHAAKAYLACEQIPAEGALEAMTLYSDRLVDDKRASQAVSDSTALAERLDQPEARAAIYLLAGRIELDSLALPADAIETLTLGQALLVDRSPGNLSRELWRAIGDAHRMLADYDSSEAAYTQAEPDGARLPGREAFDEGDYARHVETYLDDRDFAAADEYLELWARQLPHAPLEGYWSLWQTRRHLLVGDNAAAVAEADILLAINPASPYSGEIAMLKANAWFRLDNMEQYAQTLRDLVEQYPESPYAAQAAQRLRGE